jgi:hypothetical protein
MLNYIKFSTSNQLKLIKLITVKYAKFKFNILNVKLNIIVSSYLKFIKYSIELILNYLKISLKMKSYLNKIYYP